MKHISPKPTGQLTNEPIDAWLDGGLMDDELAASKVVAPKFGWDNSYDVLEGKGICRGMWSACRATKKDAHHIFDVSHRLRDLGIKEQTAVDLIVRYMEPPAPPFHRAQVEDTVANAYSTAVSPPGLLSKAGRPENHWPTAEEEDPDDDSWLEGGPSVWPKPLGYDAKQHNTKLGESFLAARLDKLIFSDGVIFTLDNRKIWRALPDDELAAEIRQTDPSLILDTPRIWGMIGAIKLMVHSKARPFEWIDKPHDAPSPHDLIPFANGLLNFESGDLRPHDGRYFATGLPAFDYQPDATCPLWVEKLGEWLHVSFHPTLQEFMGYMLTPDTRIETLLAMIGATRGGKGTISHVMQCLVGDEHHCSRSMNDLAGDFGLEGTTDKRVIFIPDAHSTEPSRRGAALERIKSITGNDVLSVNRKNKGIVNVRIPARLVLVANQHPKFLDESGALGARELPLIFENSFRGKEDRDLRAKLTAELPGIANWALEGLRRLRANGNKFTIGERGREAARELAESQSPALRFARDRLVVTGNFGDHVPLATVYESYSDWASFTEELSSREKRSRDDFKNDLIAALMAQGVRYERRRWRDPARAGGPHGNAPRVRGFFGFRMKAR